MGLKNGVGGMGEDKAEILERRGSGGKCREAKTVRMRTLVECTLTKGVPSGHAFTLA